MKNQIIVALDNIPRRNALELASSVSEKVWGFKVNDLILKYGSEIISSLKKYGHVFADPKLHDIPKTVGTSVKRLVEAGADMITCHISGGSAMLSAAKEEAKEAKIIGVTMLTSLTGEDIRQIYRGWPLERFHELINESKIDGVVCAGADMPFWNMFDLVKIVPGIRPFGPVENDDQVRTSDKNRMMAIMADYLVIGRPITEAEDPKETVQKIKEIFA